MSSGETKSDLDVAFDNLKSSVLTNLDSKHQRLFREWLNLFSGYLAKEKSFDPLKETLKYDPGTILAIELGYNPGSEHGGNHYAVVVEDNAKSSPVVMIVPLGSIKPGKQVHFNDVDLGEIPEINRLSRYPQGTKSVAIVSQMRAISKMRINAPVRSGDQVIIVPVPKLRELYAKIRTRFTTKGLNKNQ